MATEHNEEPVTVTYRVEAPLYRRLEAARQEDEAELDMGKLSMTKALHRLLTEALDARDKRAARRTG